MSKKDQSDYDIAKKHLAPSDPARRLFGRIEHSRKEFTLSTNNRHDDRFDGKNTIYWDPKSALTTPDGKNQSPALGLVHEIDHALTNPIFSAIRLFMSAGKYDNLEERRVIEGSERAIAHDIGEGIRHDHAGDTYHVQDPADR
jgi:hypothetical protein